LIALGAWSVALVGTAVAQSAAAPDTPQPRIALLTLYPPVYPPLARQARILGDVKIEVHVRKDGTVDSAEVVSGHPMLKQAALDSAQKSTFECQGCGDAVTSFTLTYTFGTRDDLADFHCSSTTRLRSGKCLYLWKCGGWRNTYPPRTAVGHSSDHVMVLGDPTCVDTATAR
jgi:TonB family protein